MGVRISSVKMGTAESIELDSRQIAFPLGYKPALDGLRGLAIVSVMAFNGGLSWMRGGFVGVDVFFVLSGFLITALLVQEHRLASSIKIREFYIRRAIRLLPALLLLVLFCIAFSLVLQTADSASLTIKGVIYTLFYVANWAQVPPNAPGIGALSHAWSLSVEEQFYILWPLMLLVLLKLRRRWLVLTLLVLFIGGSIFLNIWFCYTKTPHLRMYFGTDTRANEILIGCIVALLFCWGAFRSSDRLRALWHSGATTGLAFLLFAFYSFRHNEAIVYNGGFALASLATGILIVDLVRFPSLISRCFEVAPLVWIGKISYGLYLWHFPIFEATRKLLEGKVNPGIYSVAGVAITLLTATLSYYFLEKPLLDRFRRGRAVRSGTQLVVSTARAA